MNWLLEPLELDFFLRAIAAISLVSVLCALIGAWVVLRGLSYIGDAMSHAVLPGIVGAFITKGNLLVGAMIAAILTALSISAISHRSGLKQDSAIGIVFVGMFALGVVMLSRTTTFASHLSHFLIGNPLGVSTQDLWSTFWATLVVGGILTVIQKELLLASFDTTEARAVGLPVKRLESFLLVLVGMVVVLTVQLVGTTLSVSLLITSSATARLLTNNLTSMMIVAAILGILGGLTGLYLSYYLDTAPGATIVLINTAVFLLTLLFKRKK